MESIKNKEQSQAAAVKKPSFKLTFKGKGAKKPTLPENTVGTLSYFKEKVTVRKFNKGPEEPAFLGFLLSDVQTLFNLPPFVVKQVVKHENDVVRYVLVTPGEKDIKQVFINQRMLSMLASLCQLMLGTSQLSDDLYTNGRRLRAEMAESGL